MLATAEVAAENEQPVTDVPGIDLDVTNISTDSDGVGALAPDAGPKKLDTILALLTTATRQAVGQWRRRLPDAETADAAS